MTGDDAASRHLDDQATAIVTTTAAAALETSSVD